jgi:crossover junction endodeoxyribonuclease RuvC
MSDSIRILGIDPGSRVTGFGVIALDGSQTRPLEWGCIRTSGEHLDRLRQIHERVGELIESFRPDEIAIERVFLSRNADSALKLGQARAAALCATFSATATIHEYAAREIKKALVGNGGADKDQVEYMVRLVLGISDALEADAADALAAAVCHAQVRATRGLMMRAADSRRASAR